MIDDIVAIMRMTKRQVIGNQEQVIIQNNGETFRMAMVTMFSNKEKHFMIIIYNAHCRIGQFCVIYHYHCCWGTTKSNRAFFDSKCLARLVVELDQTAKIADWFGFRPLPESLLDCHSDSNNWVPRIW